jgi:Methyltransferase domain
MSEYSADWLALREPYDRAARNAAVLDAVACTFAGQGAISVVDLACGTGSTMRAIRRHLPARQSWRLVDNSLSLLARVASYRSPSHLTVATAAVDLARDLELALDGPLDLVTTSALLDIVSPAWLDRLIVEVASRRLPFYGALTYDGRAVTQPLARYDLELLAGFNLHQRTNKGFGPALGPAAAARAAQRFEEFGYTVELGQSDWVFGPDDRAIQEAVFVSWAEIGPLTTTLSSHEISGWLAWRRAHLAEGRSRLRIGHIDIFARPIGRR